MRIVPDPILLNNEGRDVVLVCDSGPPITYGLDPIDPPIATLQPGQSVLLSEPFWVRTLAASFRTEP